MSRKSLVAALVVVACIGLAIAAGNSSVSNYFRERFMPGQKDNSGKLIIWHPWGGIQKELLEKVVREFEKTHPDIKVRTVFTTNVTGNCQKFFTAIAAGKAPDVVFVDGTQVAEWACQGAIVPVGDRIKKANISASDYFTPCWKACCYKDQVWALTYCVDPNFALGWNKTAFKAAGLDPNRPPETIEELDRMSATLTTRRGGDLITMGIIPWNVYGPDNSIFTWGIAFGGSFYNEKTGKITANDPKIVAALEWMCSYGKTYDVKKISGLMQGFGSLERYPFFTGQLGIHPLHISLLQDAKRFAPNLDFGLGYIPHPKGGLPHSSWIGGWCMAIPKGSKQPEKGWEFMKWACADPKGTDIVASTQNLFPGYRNTLYYPKIQKDARYAKFLEILKQCKTQRPVIPATGFFMGSLSRAVEAALYGVKTPKQALDDCTIETQQELDLRMAGK